MMNYAAMLVEARGSGSSEPTRDDLQQARTLYDKAVQLAARFQQRQAAAALPADDATPAGLAHIEQSARERREHLDAILRDTTDAESAPATAPARSCTVM